MRSAAMEGTASDASLDGDPTGSGAPPEQTDIMGGNTAEMTPDTDEQGTAATNSDPPPPSEGAPDTEDPETSEPVLPAADVAEDGAFATRQDLSTGPDRESGLFFPTELGRDGLKHPLFLWGCGGGSTPRNYVDHMNRIASHGFVVLAVVCRIGDDGDVLTENLDWLVAENDRADSPLYGQLDPSRIGAGGHSIGSVNTFFMVDDPRLLTTIHVAGGSLDDVNDVRAATTGMGGMRLIHPAAFFVGETDTFGNNEKLEKDYAAATAPLFFATLSSADHINVARRALPPIVAWLRWHVAGETALANMFLDAAGAFQMEPYAARTKNW